MLKTAIVGLYLILSLHVSSFGEDLKQKEDDKVEKSLKKMLRAYKNKNIKAFFVHISENGFLQDYIEFYDAIEDDFRANSILSLDIWIDKITVDKNKRFLYVKWHKTYIDKQNEIEITKEGNSIFLFDRKKKMYKLIDYKGDGLFGVS